MSLFFLLSACSFGTLSVQECEDHSTCRDAFGWGSVCGEEGFCETAEIPARCQRTYPQDLLSAPESYADAVILGSVYDEKEFPLEVQAIDLAFFQANDSGGFGGRSVGVIHCTSHEDPALDDLSQEEANVEMAVFLADQLGLPGLVGPETSSRVEAAFEAVSPYETLLLSPSATSDALIALDNTSPTDADPGLLWRTAPPDSLQGEVIAADMASRDAASGDPVSNVAVIYRLDSYGEGLAASFGSTWEGGGGSAAYFSYESASQLADTIVDVGGVGFDEVLFISSEKDEIVSFLNGAAQLSGYEALGIFLTDGAYDTGILADASQAASLFDQIRGTRPSTPAGSVYDAFVASFSAYYQGQDASDAGYTAYAYDAAWLLLYGAAWSELNEAGISGTGAARGLRQVSEGAQVEIRASGWPDVYDSFSEGLAVDVVGASGELDFDPATEETVGPIDVWEVSADGQGFETLYTVSP